MKNAGYICEKSIYNRLRLPGVVIHFKYNKTISVKKKQIHDVETKVYLHTYNNEKKERDTFIS